VAEGVVVCCCNDAPGGARRAGYAVRTLLQLVGVPFRFATAAELRAGMLRPADTVLLTYGTFDEERYDLPCVHLRASRRGWELIAGARPLPTAFDEVHEGVPILFRSERTVRGRVRVDSDRAVADVDVVASAFFLLARCEERSGTDRDRLGRFPASSALAHRTGRLTCPLVNEYAELLWRLLSAVAPQIERRSAWGEGFALCVTHDIDQLALFSSARQVAGAVRRIAHGPSCGRRILRLATDGISVGLRRRKDPYDTFAELQALERRRGVRATYFAMSGGRGPHEGRYRLEDAAALLDLLQGHGHEIGIHGSLRTWRNATRLRSEIASLEAILSVPVHGGRQHYLRFQAPETWRAAARAGLRYDTTLGYPDAIGFRAGICTPYRPYDLHADEELPLWELPLAVMDATLLARGRLPAGEARRAVAALGRAVARRRGVLVLLWHQPSLYDALQPDGEAILAGILDDLLSMGGEPMTAFEAVERWARHAQALVVE